MTVVLSSENHLLRRWFLMKALKQYVFLITPFQGEITIPALRVAVEQIQLHGIATVLIRQCARPVIIHKKEVRPFGRTSFCMNA